MRLQPYNLNVTLGEPKEDHPLRKFPGYTDLLAYAKENLAGERNVTPDGRFQEGHKPDVSKVVDARIPLIADNLDAIGGLQKILSGEQELDPEDRVTVEVIYDVPMGKCDLIAASDEGFCVAYGLLD